MLFLLYGIERHFIFRTQTCRIRSDLFHIVTGKQGNDRGDRERPRQADTCRPEHLLRCIRVKVPVKDAQNVLSLQDLALVLQKERHFPQPLF